MRSARHAGQQGACPSICGHAKVEKLATDLPSQTAEAANPTESLSQKSPSIQDRVGTNTKRTNSGQKWKCKDYIDVMFCYHKAKADPMKV